MRTPEEGLLTNSTTVEVNGSTDPNVLIFVKALGSSGTNNASATSGPDGEFSVLIQLVEGFNRVTVQARYPLGWAINITRNVTVDLTPPSLEIVSPKGWPTYTKSKVVTIVANYDMGTWIPFPPRPDAGVFQREVQLVEGENMIDVRLSDETGNEAVEWVYIVADWTPPNITLTTPEENPFLTNDGCVNLSGTVGMGAVGVNVVYLDRVYNVTNIIGNLDTCATWQYYLDLDPYDQETTLRVMAHDSVGNEAEVVVDVILDTIPPKIHLEQVGNFTNNQVLYMNGTVDDLGISMIEVNGVYYPVEDGEFSILISLKVGYNDIDINVKDGAGNVDKIRFVVYNRYYHPYIDVGGVKRLGENRYLIWGKCNDYGTIEIDGTDYPVNDSMFRVEIDVAHGTDRVQLRVEDPTGKATTQWVDLETREETAVNSIIVMVMTVAVIITALVMYISHRRDRQA